MSLLNRLKWWGKADYSALSLRLGAAGERAAKRHLRKRGLKYLTGNFGTDRVVIVISDGTAVNNI